MGACQEWTGCSVRRLLSPLLHASIRQGHNKLVRVHHGSVRRTGHSCPAHPDKRGKRWGHSCLAFARTGLGIYALVQEEQCTLHKRMINQQKGEMEVVNVLLATDCMASYGRESPVIKRASSAEWYVEARQQCRVEV